MTTKAELDLSGIAAMAIDHAKKAGAKEARAAVERTRYVELRRAEGALESIDEATQMNLNLALFVEGRYSTHMTSDLRPAALEQFVRNAVAMTRYLAQDPNRTLPPPALYAGYEAKDLKTLDAAHSSIDTDARTTVLSAIDQALIGKHPSLVRVESGWYDEISDRALVNSNGFSGSWSGTTFQIDASLTAKDAQGSISQVGELASRRFRADLAATDRIAEEALTRTVRALGAKPMKTQRLPMVVENRVARRLVGQLVQPMSAQSIQQRQSFLEGKKGQKIASPLLTMVDDPLLVGGLASRLFDFEGIPARRRVMIEKGVLQEYWTNVYYGNKLGWTPTAAGPSNLTFSLGTLDAAALMKKAGKGILVTGFLGGNANSTTGDFSVGISGFYFENGQFVQPVKEMNVAGNQIEFWNQLAELGNDPWLESGIQTPTMLFDKILFSGV